MATRKIDRMKDRARIRYGEELERIKQLRKRVSEVRLRRLEDEEERRQKGEKKIAAENKNTEPEKMKEDTN